MNTPTPAMVSRAPVAGNCPVPPAGRSFMVAIVLSLAVHAVAIAAAGIWVATNKPASSEEPVCPVTQFMKVHLIKSPALQPLPQLASVESAPIRKATPAKPAAKSPSTQQAAVRTTNPQAKTVAAPAQATAPAAEPAHPDFIAEAPAAKSSSYAGSSPSTAIPAQLASGSNAAITYPPAARRMGWEGVVTLKFWLNANGSPSQFRIANSSGFPVLDGKALQTVRNWRFQPHILNGEATPVWAELPVTFRLTE